MPALVLAAFLAFADTPEATVAAFVKAFNEGDGPALARQIVGGVVPVGPFNPSHVTVKATITKTTLSEEDAYLEVDMEATGQVMMIPSGGRKGHETVHLRRIEGDWRIVPLADVGLPNIGTIAMFATDAPLVRVMRQARQAARTTACLSNVKQLAVATLMYSADHDDVLPKDASRWKASVMPYAKDEGIFHCPDDASGGVSYFFEPRLAGRSQTAIDDIAGTAMILEGTPKAVAYRHEGRACLAYADGHAKVARPALVELARKVRLP